MKYQIRIKQSEPYDGYYQLPTILNVILPIGSEIEHPYVPYGAFIHNYTYKEDRDEIIIHLFYYGNTDYFMWFSQLKYWTKI